MEGNNYNEDIKSLLKENQRLLIQNNQILRSLRRSQWVSLALKTLWLAFIFGSLWYSYANYIAPNLEQIQSFINTFQNTNFDKSIFTDWFDSFSSPK